MKLSYKLCTTSIVCVMALLIGFSGGLANADEDAIQMDEWTLSDSSISNPGLRSSVPSIALQADGTLHAAFKQGSTISITDNEPFYVKSTDGGSTWSSPQIIKNNPDTFVVDKVEIAVGSSGVVHAAWVERNPTTNSYDLLYSSNSSGTWSATQSIESVSVPFVIDQPSMVLDGGRVHLVWASSSTIRYATRTSGTWSAPKEIESSSSELPEIAIDSSGTLHVVYLQSRDTLVVRYSQSTDGGTTWTPDVSLSSSGRDAKDVDIDVKGTTVHVAFGASDVVGSVIVPIASTPIVRPYHRSCSTNCTSTSSWTNETSVSSFEAGNRPADAVLLVPTVSIIDSGAALVFFHGVLEENTNFEQILGSCFEPNTRSGKSFKLPTSFTERMVKPQIVYTDGIMHMVYEKVQGQSTSADLQQVHYAQLNANCYDLYLPISNKN